MGISGGVVGLEWGNIEDAMDWFPQVFEAERAVETPQTQGSCQCPFNQVWEKTYETSMGTFDLYTRKN